MAGLVISGNEGAIHIIPDGEDYSNEDKATLKYHETLFWGDFSAILMLVVLDAYSCLSDTSGVWWSDTYYTSWWDTTLFKWYDYMKD
jgi:hypothetical protein